VLHQGLNEWAARQPEAVFAAEAGRRLTWAEAQAATRRLAGAFQAAGVLPGDRVAVVSRNRIEVVLLYYAAARAGVTLVPLNTRLAPEEWTYLLADAQPRVVFVDAPFLEAIERAGMRCVALDPTPGRECFDTWLAHAPAQTDASVDPELDVLQLYTSATTGRPKGAVLTHRAVCANIDQIGHAVGISPGEVSLVVAPLFHAAVLPSTLTPLAHGGSVYLQSEFRPAEVARALEEERIGFAVLVPAMLQACLADVPDLHPRGFPNLRLIYYGSSPIAEPTLRAAIQAFNPGSGFIQSYGMTEASQAVTFLTPDDHRLGLSQRPELLLSAGKAAPDTQIAIGEAGEVLVRGPQLMRGYWGQPEATASALQDGWLHTGDVGTLDQDGYLTIRDRLKDMIVSGGENVYPRAIEEVLARHPSVAEAAVIGVPDPRWGETVKAVIVPRAGSLPTAEDLIAFCRKHLGGFEVPRSVDIVDSVPRNASGKVLKRVLREAYWAGQGRRVAGA
jgi:acyl-CoA synthetase (AMP-forming)/AMP-acid ligase II